MASHRLTRPLPEGETARKTVHLLMAVFALTLRWLTWQQAAICAIGASLVVLLFRIEIPSSRENARARGVRLYPWVVLILILLFRDLEPPRLGLAIAAFGWGLLAGGDACAGVVGMKWGHRVLIWNPEKTLEGLLGFLIGGSVLGTALFAWVAHPISVVEMARHAAGWHLLVLFLAVLAAGFLETVPHGLDDNVLPPIAGAFTLAALAAAHDGLRPVTWTGTDSRSLVVAVVVNSIIVVPALKLRWLDSSGMVVAFVLGVVTLTFGGVGAYCLLGLFLALGTLATLYRRSEKRLAGLEDESTGRRGVANVVANGTVCGFGCVLYWLSGGGLLAVVIIVASLAAACADTLASEFGKVHGKRAVLLPVLRRVPPGTEGAVSLQGSLAGLGGALVIVAVAYLFGLVDSALVLPLTCAGFLAMLAESLLPRLGPYTNTGTNLANTTAAPLLAYFAWSLGPSFGL